MKAAIAARPERLEAILAEASVDAAGRADRWPSARDIDRLFAADRLEDILAALAADPSRMGGAAARRCCAPNRRGVQDLAAPARARARELDDFADEMRMEYRPRLRMSIASMTSSKACAR